MFISFMSTRLDLSSSSINSQKAPLKAFFISFLLFLHFRYCIGTLSTSSILAFTQISSAHQYHLQSNRVYPQYLAGIYICRSERVWSFYGLASLLKLFQSLFQKVGNLNLVSRSFIVARTFFCRCKTTCLITGDGIFPVDIYLVL